MSTNTIFKVEDFIDHAQMKQDLNYSPNNLTDAMMTQASLFAHYGVLAAKASRQVDVVKMLLENTEAAVYRKVRDAAVQAGEKVTESQVKADVEMHDKVRAMRKALNEAKQIESVAKIAVEAFRHRRDMLVQQGLISREEMKGELSVAVRQARENELDAQKEAVLERRRARMEDSAAN